MAKLNISDIVTEFSEDIGLPKKTCQIYVNRLFEKMLEHLEAGDEINVKNFGKFEMIATAPKKIRNINSGQLMVASSKNRIRFTMARSLSDRYNKRESEVE